MKKLLVPLLVIIPVIIFWKLRNSSSVSDGDEKIPDEEPVKAAVKKNTVRKNETKSPEKKTTAVKNARCKATTASGKKCARESLPDSEFCWQHS